MKKLICAALLLTACHAPRKDSSLQEAPDSKNRVSRFALAQMPTYDAIKDIRSVRTSVLPWSDTYWPLMEKGLSRRWADSAKRSLIGFVEFFKEQKEAGEKKRVSAYLSPAEKYDIAFRERHGIKVKEEDLAKELALFAEAENQMTSSSSLESLRASVATMYKNLDNAEELKRWSPMAVDGWNSFLAYTKNPKYQFLNQKDSGESWSWMGYCHGWAPAANMSLAPKHSVMARIGDKEIFFSEGDIRGLLTKSWADHAPKNAEYFLGRRCNENVNGPEGEIPHDSKGRGLSGSLVIDGKTKSFNVVDEYLPGSAALGRRVFQISLEDDVNTYYMLEQDTKTYFLADTRELSRPFVEKGQTAGTRALKDVKFFGCWDINPASFHTVLTQYLPKDDIGFVMDRTRTGQVWNQPIWGADFQLGELQRADSVDDVAFMHRAEDTVYLMVVKARVLWSTEPDQPRLVYPPNFDQKHIKHLDYTYTLEFDADKNLIGGEWGDLKGINPAQVTPDFLFGYKKGSVPFDYIEEGFDYSGIIGPVHACSLQTNDLKSAELDGETITYSICDLKRAD